MTIHGKGPQVQRFWTVLPVILGVGGVVLVLGVHALAGGSTKQGGLEADLIGDWQATGQVLDTHDSVTQAPGEILHREWSIAKACDQTCALEMTRQVAGLGPDPITAPLVWSGDHWQANFEQANVACQGDDRLVSGVEDSTWTIRLDASGTITATESTSTHDSACLTATSTLRWSASKLSTQQLAPA